MILFAAHLHPLEQNEILNINVPAIPFDLIKGIVTRTCKRHRAETMVQSTDPLSRTIYYRLEKLGSEQDAGEGTDFDVKQYYCSVTPLSVDMTVHEKVSKNTLVKYQRAN
jgi:5'-nucleotidase